MRKTMRDPLPPLKPIISGSDVDTPREIVTKSIISSNPRISTDFEVNRSLFMTVSSTAKSPLVQNKKRIIPPKSNKLLPDIPSSAPRKFVTPPASTSDAFDDSEIDKIAQKVENEENKSENEQENEILEANSQEYISPELLEIQRLVQRIPDPDNPDFNIDNIYRITPALDRILSTVTDFSPKYILSLLDHPIIQDLWSHLFALIDVDDFLLRTIICRILLSFAVDSSSPLLLPVAQIFYKLSCDQNNDVFFVDESLHEVLISIIRIASPEARVYAAGTLKNLSVNEDMRDLLVSSDFLNLFEDTINEYFNAKTDPNPDDSSINSSDLCNQLIITTRHLCKSDHFKAPLVQRNIIQKLFDDQKLTFEGLKLAVIIPDLPLEIKLDILSILTNNSLDHLLNYEDNNNNTESNQKSINHIKVRFLLNLADGIENKEEYLVLLIHTIKDNLNNNIDNEDDFVNLLNEAKKCLESKDSLENAKKVFENDTIFIDILNSPLANMTMSTITYSIIKNLNDEKFAQAKIDFSMFDESK